MAPRKKKAAVETTAAERTYAVKGPTDGFFETVESNIKGGVRVGLGACTAVVSERNRAGKTAVLDSVRFALTGTHPIGPHYADLCGLTADGSAPWATLEAVGKQRDARSLVPSGKKSVAHDDTLGLSDAQRANLLPLSALRDLLTLGTAKAREELFRRFGTGSDVSAATVPAGLSPEQEKVWKQAFVYSTPAADPAEKLASAGEWIRKEKRRLSTEMKSLEDEKARLRESVEETGTVTDAEIADIEATIGQHVARAKVQALIDQKDALGERLTALIDTFSATSKPLTDEEFHARPELAQRKTMVEAAAKKWREAEAMLSVQGHVLRNAQQVLILRKCLNAGCLVCDTVVPVNVSQRLIREMEESVTQLEAQAAPLKAEVAQAQRDYEAAVRAETAGLSAEKDEWRRQVRAYEDLAAQVKTTSEQYKAVVAALEAVGVTGEAPEGDVHALNDRLRELREAQSRQARYAAIGGDIRTLTRTQNDVKEVEKVIAEVTQDLVVTTKVKAEQAVNQWMPAGFKAALRLEDSEGKPVCRWEIIGADGTSHPRGAASGAEWSALAVALSCAWTEGSPYRFLLLDDADIAGFSAENVKNLLDTVSAAVQQGRLTQAFVAWSRPEEVPTKGWTVVQL
jgi:DNA repair exonuclease SbcCD ATPase subunit